MSVAANFDAGDSRQFDELWFRQCSMGYPGRSVRPCPFAQLIQDRCAAICIERANQRAKVLVHDVPRDDPFWQDTFQS